MTDPFEREAKPWDLYNKNLGRVSTDIAQARLTICRSCEHLIKSTEQCNKCWCFMQAKVKLPNADCPLHKWGQATGLHTPDFNDGLPKNTP